jgi:hypothetical protein
MTGYLTRLKTLLAQSSPTRQTDKTDESPSVSFVSDQGRHVSGDEGAEAGAIEERAGLAADRVPPIYLDAWARLNCQKPASVSEAEWRLALDDSGRFLDAWGSEAADMRWTPGEVFDVTAGLVWRLGGERVGAIGADHVRLRDGRTIKRKGSR